MIAIIVIVCVSLAILVAAAMVRKVERIDRREDIDILWPDDDFNHDAGWGTKILPDELFQSVEDFKAEYKLVSESGTKFDQQGIIVDDAAQLVDALPLESISVEDYFVLCGEPIMDEAALPLGASSDAGGDMREGELV